MLATLVRLLFRNTAVLLWCIFFVYKFPDMILVYFLKSSYKRTPDTLSACAVPFLCLRKQFTRKGRYEIVILQETSSMWSCSEL